MSREFKTSNFQIVNIFYSNRRIYTLKIIVVVGQQIGVDVFCEGENQNVWQFDLFRFVFAVNNRLVSYL